MSSPVSSELTDIAVSMERNFIAGFRLLGGIGKAVFRENESIVELWSGYKVSWMNGVFRVDGGSQNLAAEVSGALSRFSEIPFQWRIGVLTPHASLVQKELISSGFKPAGSSPGLFLPDAGCLTKSAKLSELEVRMVRSFEEVNDWLLPYSSGFEVPADVTSHFEDYIKQRLGISSCESWFVGYLNGRPVTSAYTLTDSGITMLYNVATVPEFRRLGCAGLTVASAIESAWRKFNLPIGLYSSDSGLSLYRRMGFKYVYDLDSYRF